VVGNKHSFWCGSSTIAFSSHSLSIPFPVSFASCRPRPAVGELDRMVSATYKRCTSQVREGLRDINRETIFAAITLGILATNQSKQRSSSECGRKECGTKGRNAGYRELTDVICGERQIPSYIGSRHPSFFFFSSFWSSS